MRFHQHILALVLAALPLLATAGPASMGEMEKALRPVLQQHCTKCHGDEGKVKGKVNLVETTMNSLLEDPDYLEELIDVLKFDEMPPEDEPALPAKTRKEMIGHLESLLETALASEQFHPQTPIRRMNRFQYNNAVQDLFDLDAVVFTLPERMLRDHGGYFDPASGKMPDSLRAGCRPLGKSQLIERRLAGVAPFPQDLRAEHGFDNRGDHLSLSPLLLESFMKLSRSIVESTDFHEGNCGIWKSFFAEPGADEVVDTAIRERLREFLSKAFRRPVDDSILNRYADHVRARIKNGDTFTTAMKLAASAALASPRFLYLYDGASRGAGPGPLDDFELATRLSFFLWGSIPDEQLLDLAGAGKLGDPGVLRGEVKRMLNDKRMKRFCDSFPSQWMQLEGILASVPDRETWPQFYFSKYRASMHMMLEPLLLFETILVENRPITELIDADYSYRSALLVSWYENTNPTKTPPTTIPFERVAVTDRREGGVITNAAIMTMTSNSTRTQPITRGAWIASVIFNDPPDPPPADVPPLPEKSGEDEDKLTIRERFEAHRTRDDCKGCHAQLDPLGFALENYGPTGIWRDNYENGRKVDASGVLFRKYPFTGSVDFKDAILAEKERFAGAFAAHLLSFALGRETGATDSPALDQVVAMTAENGYRLREMIEEIVLSKSFRIKANPPGKS